MVKARAEAMGGIGRKGWEEIAVVAQGMSALLAPDGKDKDQGDRDMDKG